MTNIVKNELDSNETREEKVIRWQAEEIDNFRSVRHLEGE